MKSRVIAALAFAVAAAAAHGAPAPAECCNVVQHQSEAGIPYASGGVGEDERNALAAATAGYSLKLVFAEKGSGHYLSDVRVAIKGSKGKDILEAVSDGPWFLAKLPPGSYQVTAAFGEQRQTRSVIIGKQRQKTVAFHF